MEGARTPIVHPTATGLPSENSEEILHIEATENPAQKISDNIPFHHVHVLVRNKHIRIPTTTNFKLSQPNSTIT